MSITFVESIEHPEIWFHQAREMYEASLVNYECFQKYQSQVTDRERQRHLGLMKTAMLTLGFSVENALKGAVVAANKPDLSAGSLDPQHFHNHAHDLLQVAQKLKLKLSKDDQEYLARLTLFIEWAGRYKAPLQDSKFKKAEGQLRMRYPRDFERAQQLIEHLQTKAGYDPHTGWPCWD